MWCECWPFLLRHSLHPNFLQAISNCLCRDRLVDNITESFGDLDCIFSSPWANKANSMTNVGPWKLCWMTSWGLLKTGTMFGAKSEDSSIGNTSLRWDLVTREARIKESKDMVLQCRCVKFVLERDFGVVRIFGVVGFLEVSEVVGCSDGLWLQLWCCAHNRYSPLFRSIGVVGDERR